MKPYQVIVVDDHPAIRQSIKAILSENREFEVTAEVADGYELLQFLRYHPILPDLIIMDISMPRLQGIEATRIIKRFFPDLKVLILSVHKEREYITKAFMAGANGYVFKPDANAELVEAIQAIRGGSSYRSAHLNSSVH